MSAIGKNKSVKAVLQITIGLISPRFTVYYKKKNILSGLRIMWVADVITSEWRVEPPSTDVQTEISSLDMGGFWTLDLGVHRILPPPHCDMSITDTELL